jgi:hypothetical protein
VQTPPSVGNPVPHRPGPPPPQNPLPLHVLQLAVTPPQPSLCWPHVPEGKLAHVFATHGAGSELSVPPPASPVENPFPHWFGPPPPHHCPDEQVVQTPVIPPQPSP